MEMYQIVTQTAAEKPDEAHVNQLLQDFTVKSLELKKQLKNKFKEMRTVLKVQEQTTEAILKKNSDTLIHKQPKEETSVRLTIDTVKQKN